MSSRWYATLHVTPVSYTHLDVDKRQARRRGWEPAPVDQGRGGGAMSDDVQLVREIGEVKAELSGLKAEVAGTNQPVSYTHLKNSFYILRLKKLMTYLSLVSSKTVCYPTNLSG